MDFSAFPQWMPSSIGTYQLHPNDRYDARDELRRHHKAKIGVSSRKKRERFEDVSQTIDGYEDYHLTSHYIRTFQPSMYEHDDLWRRCDAGYWKYVEVEKQSKDEFFKLLKLIKYVNRTERAEPGRDYEALWDEIKGDWIQDS